MVGLSSRRVAAILERCHGEIAAAWVERVLSLGDMRYGRRSRRELEEWSRQDLRALIRKLEHGSSRELDDHVRRVVTVRRKLGFRIDEIVEGLLLLMEVAVLHLAASYPPGGPESRAALCQVEECFRHLVARAAAIYADAMRSSVERLTVLEERQKLARDLHDAVTQAIYGVSLYTEAAARQLAAGDDVSAAESLIEARDTSLQALREMRLLLFELRPPDLVRVGLPCVLRERLSAVEARGGIRADLRCTGPRRLEPRVEDGLHRIAQEALNNVLKHAMAQQVRVDLHQVGDRIVLEIADDGRGFDIASAEARGGLGLRNIRERGHELDGSVTVHSRLGEGTRVRAEVPAVGFPAMSTQTPQKGADEE